MDNEKQINHGSLAGNRMKAGATMNHQDVATRTKAAFNIAGTMAGQNTFNCATNEAFS